MAENIDIKKLFDLLAERLNTPVNMKLDVRAIVKEIPDSKHGMLTTLIVFNTSEEAMKDGASAIDNRIIDDADLFEQGVITLEDEETDIDVSPSDLVEMIKLLSKIERKEGAYSRDHLTHAENCIKNMSEHAKECLKLLRKKRYATKPYFPSR